MQTLRSLGTASQDILTANYRSVLAAQRMKEAAERIDSAALFIVAGQRGEGGSADRTRTARVFEAELAVEEGNITEPGETEAARRAAPALGGLPGTRSTPSPDPPAAPGAEAYFRDLEPRFLAVKAAADRVLDMNQAAMVRKSEHAQAVARRLEMATLLAAVIALGPGRPHRRAAPSPAPCARSTC